MGIRHFSKIAGIASHVIIGLHHSSAFKGGRNWTMLLSLISWTEIVSDGGVMAPRSSSHFLYLLYDKLVFCIECTQALLGKMRSKDMEHMMLARGSEQPNVSSCFILFSSFRIEHLWSPLSLHLIGVKNRQKPSGYIETSGKNSTGVEVRWKIKKWIHVRSNSKVFGENCSI